VKVYKSEPGKYGWYWVIHKLMNGDIKVFYKTINKGVKAYERNIHLGAEGLELLKKAMRDEK